MKYIFWGPEFKPSYAMFKQIFDRDDVKYIRYKVPSYVLVKIYKIFKILRPLIRRYILGHSILQECLNDEEIVFVYYNPWGEFLAESENLKILKKRYRNSLHVVLLFDVRVARGMDIRCLKNNYDRVYIYDQEEAGSLGISYFPPVYSKNFMVPPEETEEFDVSFVGHAKERMKDVIEVFDKLTAAGLKCKFYIVGAEPSMREYRDGIVYGKRYLKEKEYFQQYIIPSKCLLEIRNADIDALTARVREAVMYDKKILSNNGYLKKYKYYCENMMQVYKNVDDIDIDFFKKKKVSYHYEGDFSPVLFLEELKCVYEKENN